MRSKFISARVNQEVIRDAMTAKYASVNVKTVGSNIIAVITLNRSLLLYLNHLSRFLGAKHF
jgi:hypothetical protein